MISQQWKDGGDRFLDRVHQADHKRGRRSLPTAISRARSRQAEGIARTPRRGGADL
jgi:hypothetical protein